MGFFSGLRKKVKKFIPKEIRPFVPYLAAAIPGLQGMGMLSGIGSMAARKALIAGGTKFLIDDEADLKDVGITAALAGAPSALGEYASTGNAAALKMGDPGFFTQQAKLGAAKLSGMAADKPFTTLASQGGIDYGIKAAELNKDALARYNEDLARQGINDKAGRRAAIRAIYEGTGTWDMDEVDGMLDTYGYRTGGRVGYALGDKVDTEQIIEDFQRIPSITKGIGNLARAGVDNIDKIIEVIIKTNPILATGDKIIEILVERYGVDPEVAQRKVINRMSDSNEGFGPQGPDGTPDDGYKRNIGIDAGAEDYYGETPAMPENLGDMGGNMDDMSGNSILNRLNRGEKYEEEAMPIPMPEMRPLPLPRDFEPNYERMPLPADFEPKYERMPLPLDYEPKYTFMMSGGRVGLKNGGTGEDHDAIDSDVDGIITMKSLIKDHLINRDDDDEENTKPKRRRKDDDLGENIEMAIDGYNRLYPEIKPASIRPLSFEDGGSVDDRLMERVKELQDEGLDFASALAQAMKEDMASGKARGGIMDGIDVNMREQIDTPRGDMMIDENMEVADSSLMDAYEIYRFDMMEQGLDPMSLEEFRDQAISEGQMASGDMDVPIQDLADEFEITFGRPANSLDELKDFYKQKYEFNGDVSMMEGSEGQMASMEAGQEATLEEIYIELLDSGMNPEDAAIKAREIYNSMSSKSSSGRTMAAEGGLMNLGGKEMDLRGGGFVPMGAKERADDVPARLSKNEFVMTADAVRAAGGGSVQKGADLMYDQMKQLEGQA